MYEGENKSNGEQHRGIQVNISTPQREYPVVNLYGGWHCNDQRRGGEKETEIRIHAAHVHVMRPDHEA